MQSVLTTRPSQHSIGWGSHRRCTQRSSGRIRPFVSSSSSKSGSTSKATEDQVVELGRKASKKFSELSDRAKARVQREWTKLNAEHDIEGKAARAAKKMEETAKEVDQTYNVRRKLRNAVEYAQRKWPVWRTQLDQFATTWYGKAAILLVLLAIMSSPLFWRALNFLLIVWWLAIPVAAAFLQAAQRKAAQRAQEEAEERERARNPFSSMFNRARQAAAGGAAASSRGAGSSAQQAGPIIDAEYTVLKSKDDSL